jgi:general secretion pathway protein J
MALLALMGWRGLDIMMRTRDITHLRIEDAALAQTSVAQWRADLDAMQNIPGLLNDSSMDWDGKVMRLLRRSPTPLATGADSGLRVVAWVQREGYWWRWQSPALLTRAQLKQAWELAAQWGHSPNSQLRQSETRVMSAHSWQLFYYRDNAWSNPLSSAGTNSIKTNTVITSSAGKSSNQEAPATVQARTPDGLRVVIQMSNTSSATDANTLTLEWVNPAYNPVRS